MKRRRLALGDDAIVARGARARSWLAVAMLAVTLVGQAGAQDKPATAIALHGEPEQLLQAIRSALVDAATDAPTRVVSSAWIDERGSLQESSQWHSQLRVRGVRVLSYLEPQDDGQPPRPRWKVQPFMDPAARTGAVTAQECLDAARHWRMPVRFESGVEARLIGPHAAVAALVAQQARQWWARHGSSLPRWYAQDAWPSAILPVGASAGAPASASAYQQALFGTPASPSSARLRLTVAIAPAASTFATGAIPTAPAASPSLSAQLVFEDETGRQLWREVRSLPDAPGESFAGAAALVALEQLLGQWQQALATVAPCDFPRFEARPSGASQWTLPVGRASGLQPGQRLFIADRVRIPERLLEPEALGQTVLAEVVSVSASEVALRQIAGPALPAGPRWVAWPL